MALESIDLELLSLHWVSINSDDVAVLRGDGNPLPRQLAERLIDVGWDRIARRCAVQGYQTAYVYVQSADGNEPKKFAIPADFASPGSSIPAKPPDSSVPSELIATIPEEDLSLGLLERSQLPTYINAIRSQKKFYANPTALNAQGKPPEDFLTGNAYDLNDPDELDSRTTRIASGETLTAYEYEGWRWYFDPNAGRFRLKRMALISNFRLIHSFNGVPCWLGQVLEATELATKRL